MEPEIQEIKNRLEALENREIDRDISVEQQEAISEIVKKNVQDVFWEEFFYIHEFFDTTTGFTTSSSTGTVSFTKGVDFITGTSSGDHKQFGRKTPNSTEFITHEREAYFRTSLTVSEKSNQTGYVRTLFDGGYGSISSLGLGIARRSAVGFKVTDGEVHGCAQNEGKETTAYLYDIPNDVAVELELRYFPGERVDFYVDKEFRATISTNLPTLSENNTSVFEAYLQTDDSTQKKMYVEYYEFLQKRT